MKTKRFLLVILVLLVLAALLLSGCGSNEEASPGGSDGDSGDLPDNEAEPGPGEGEPDSGADDPEPDEGTGEDTWLTYSNAEHGFTIDYPGSWIDVGSGGRYPFVSRPYEGTQTTFYVDTHKSIFSDYSFDDYVEEMIGNLQRIHPDYNYSEPESVEINGYPFVAMSYTATGSDGVEYFYRGYYTANDYGYIVKYVITGPELDEIEPIAEEMVASFHFTK